MRIISIGTIKKYWLKNPETEKHLKSWYQEVESSNWKNRSELKEKYRNASVLTSKRVVFNIMGNDHRLIVDIEFRLKIVFIVWLGTHKQYDKIDSKKVSYVKTYKK